MQHTTLVENGHYMDLYACGAMAEEVIGLAEGSQVRVLAETLYGVRKTFEYTDDGTVASLDSERGLRIKSILNVEPPIAV